MSLKAATLLISILRTLALHVAGKGLHTSTVRKLLLNIDELSRLLIAESSVDD